MYNEYHDELWVDDFNDYFFNFNHFNHLCNRINNPSKTQKFLEDFQKFLDNSFASRFELFTSKYPRTLDSQIILDEFDDIWFGFRFRSHTNMMVWFHESNNEEYLEQYVYLYCLGGFKFLKFIREYYGISDEECFSYFNRYSYEGFNLEHLYREIFSPNSIFK